MKILAFSLAFVALLLGFSSVEIKAQVDPTDPTISSEADMKRILTAVIALWALLNLGPDAAWAQAQIRGVADATLPTNNGSVKITVGLTYQNILAASKTRHSLTIQNNNIGTTDTCYLLFGTNITSQVTSGTTTTSSSLTGSVTAAQSSITLAVGQSLTRYFPDIPFEDIFGTCTTANDSIHVSVQ